MFIDNILKDKKKILIVEDDDALRNLIKRNLIRLNYEVLDVDNGHSALDILLIDNSYLMLIDQRLKDTTGLDIIEKLNDLKKPVNFIVMTGQGDEKLAVKMMKLGAADYLIKTTEFLDILPEVLERTFKTIDYELKLKTAEETIRNNEENLRVTLNSIGDAVIATDIEGKITQMNPIAEKLTGWKLSDAYNKKLEDIFNIYTASTKLTAKNPVQKVLKTGEIIGLANHTVLISKEGTEYQIADSAAPIKDRNNNIIGVVLVFRDVTEEYAKQEEINNANMILESTLNAIPDMIGLLDNDYNVIRYNDAVYKILNMDKKAVIGKKCYNLISRNCICDTCAVRLAYQSGKIEQLERYDDDLKKWIELRAYPILDENNKVIHVIEHFRDITEQKLAEQEKEKLQNQLMQAQKMESIGRLAGGVAHDFNNMLSVIIGYTELTIQQLDPTSHLQKNLQEVNQAAKRSSDLTRQLLTFARKQIISPKVIDLNATISSMYKMLTRLIGEEIELIWKPSSTPVYVEADPSQIDQILANLCVNARDAIKDFGKITIETSVTTLDKNFFEVYADDKSGSYIMLTISDNGVGMTKETLSHVFEPFFTTKELGKGTGLGLSTIYGAVKQNNGYILVYSEYGHGTTFKIYLPEYKKDIVINDNKPVTKQNNNIDATVLVVEDEETILQMTVSMLSSKGCKTLSALNANEAINKAKHYKGKINLLISDIVMPEMNGYDLAKHIVQIHPDIKILFMSGYTADIIANQKVCDKNLNFIQKPFTFLDFFNKIIALLNS